MSTTSVCICTRNPRPDLFERCLDSLRRQAVGACARELLVIDNHSDSPIPAPLGFPDFWSVRVVREERAGLMHARLTALRSIRGSIMIFVDDDNLLRPGYVTAAEELMLHDESIGAAGGKLLGAPESSAPPWFEAVASDLLVRDHGDEPFEFKGNAPCGGGLVVRPSAFRQASRVPFLLVGRRGDQLLAGEDTELCLRIQKLGWKLHYEPKLVLDHFLETRRLNLPYLERMNHGFGIARPFLDLYSFEELPFRRLHYLRRWRHERFRARTLLQQASSMPAESKERVRAQLNSSYALGLATGLRMLALGNPVWKQLAKAFNTDPTSVRTHQ